MKIRKLIYAVIIAAMLVILASCGQSYEPPKSSADLYGTSSGSGYSNDYLGFSITYPDGYTVLDKDKVDDLLKNTIDSIKAQFTDPEKAEEALNASIPVTMAFKHPLDYTEGANANISIIIQNVNSALTKDIVSYGKKVVEETQKQLAGVKYGDVQGIKLDGKDACAVDMTQTQNGVELLQKQYFFACKNYSVVITLTAGDSGDMDELAKTVEGIKFNS